MDIFENINDFGIKMIHHGIPPNIFDKMYISAVSFASEKHGNQKYGEYPYIKHLFDVEGVLVDFGLNEDYLLRICALLHDVVEDTNVTLDEIEKLFGMWVRIVIDAVTYPEGKNRRERNMKLYQKIMNCDLRLHAITLKLADRIANVKQSLFECNTPLLEMYKNENFDFKKSLRDPINLLFNGNNPHKEMWNKLSLLLNDVG